MNWRVFKIDDPDTWPEIDCPILVSKSTDYYPCVYQWDSREHCFLNDYDTYYPNKCFYSYIGYLPSGYKVHHPIRCLDDKDCKIGCNDDGYCIYNNCECSQKVVVNEYEVEMERIWKEF